MFSNRLPRTLEPNRLTVAVAERRRQGAPIIDLTVSNPTAIGIDTHNAHLAAALSDADVSLYQPDPRGALLARESIAATLGQPWNAEQMLLTASTSEAYALLFKLLCSPGDRVLVPRPSYPLFELLTRLEGIEAIPYPLHYEGDWRIDLSALRARVDQRVRALLVVSPNNPTGNYVTHAEMAALADICTDRVALIADEVFREYPHAESHKGPTLADSNAGLAFVLGGLSKLAGLPQIKLSWIGVFGRSAALWQQALQRLELIADTYLSVGAPASLAADTLLREGQQIRQQLSQRVRDNRKCMSRLIAQHYPACTLLRADGGWSAVVQVPQLRSEEQLVLELLQRDGILVHPGYFFDFDAGTFVVISLLPTPRQFEDGTNRALARATARPS